MGVTAENAGDKIEQLINWISDHLPEAADWLAMQFVPILQDTWDITKDTGKAFGEMGKSFLDLMLMLTGHGELAGTEFSFQKLGVATRATTEDLKHSVLYINDALKEMSHLANAGNLVAEHKYKEAAKKLALALGPAPK